MLPPSTPACPPRHEQCYTVPLRVSKEVFKALTTSGIPFSAVKSPPGLSAIFPVAYLCAIYYFIIKRGWVVGATSNKLCTFVQRYPRSASPVFAM